MSTASVNEVRLIGNLGGDPEVRSVGEKGSVVATISIATTYHRGEDEFTEWHRVVLWNHLAERAQKYLRKGSSVYVAGRLSTRKWKDEQQQDRYTTEVVAESMQMLGSRRIDGEGEGASHGDAPAAKANAPRRHAETSRDVPPHSDQDVPF